MSSSGHVEIPLCFTDSGHLEGKMTKQPKDGDIPGSSRSLGLPCKAYFN